jgi:hypothetical protein
MVGENRTEVLLFDELLQGMGDEGVFVFAHVEAFGAVAPCARDDGQGASRRIKGLYRQRDRTYDNRVY